MSDAADILITNGRVYTVDETNPTAEAVALRGNQIMFVGSMEDAEPLKGADTQVIDAAHKTVMPGIIDSHFHTMWGALGLGDAQLESVRTREALQVELDQFIADNPDTDWVVGQGLSYAISKDKPLTRHDLDAIEPNRPVALYSFDLHTVWVNTAALKLGGFLNGGNVGAGSEIVMGADGTATGELREPGAYEPLLEHRAEFSEARKLELTREALALMAENGITSVHNMDGDPEQARLYGVLEDMGHLTSRIRIPYWVKPEDPFEVIEDIAVPMGETYNTNMLQSGVVKFFMDGVLESYTALLLEPYADKPETVGDWLFTAEHFNRMAVEADRLGLQIAVHCCGDGAVRRTLDGYQAAREANGVRDSRHRIEHIELVHPDDVPRFAELGVVASMQPLHAPMLHVEADVWPDRAGPERWHRSFAWRTLIDAGAMYAFGSDWTVVSLNPFLGFDDGLNRRAWGDEPVQRLTLEELIRGYTINGAYVGFQEKRTGQLKAGMLADIVVLDHDLFHMDLTEVAAVKPITTICDGRVTYSV